MSRNKKLTYLFTAIAVALLYGFVMLLRAQGMVNRQWTSVINFICINIILAVSLNISVGCMGQINLGHAGFMSVGAYSAGLFMKSGLVEGLPGYLIGLLLAGVIAAVIGFLIGIPALRLRGDYLAILTLGFGEIIRVLIEFFDFTGGAQGLSGIPRMNDFTIIFWIMVICVVSMYTIMTSRHGRVVLAIREDEIAAEATGVRTTNAKTFAFVLSAFFAGIAGGMYAANMGIISAKQFDYNYSINLLVMVVLGGMGSFTGATLSAIVLTVLPEMLRVLNQYRMIIYSVILIVMMLFRPSGLLGRREFQISKIVDKLFPPKKPDGDDGPIDPTALPQDNLEPDDSDVLDVPIQTGFEDGTDDAEEVMS